MLEKVSINGLQTFLDNVKRVIYLLDELISNLAEFYSCLSSLSGTLSCLLMFRRIGAETEPNLGCLASLFC